MVGLTIINIQALHSKLNSVGFKKLILLNYYNFYFYY